MTSPGNESASRTARHDPDATRTSTGADTTARMTGTYDGDQDRDRRVETVRPTDRPHGVLPAKTSVAAAFGLVFGLAALFCALTAILAPAAVLFGLIGIVVALAGMKMAKRPGVTGRGVAIGGLVTAVLGLLLGAAVLAGAAVVVNDEQRLDQLENQITDLRNDLPSTSELREQLPS